MRSVLTRFACAEFSQLDSQMVIAFLSSRIRRTQFMWEFYFLLSR